MFEMFSYGFMQKAFIVGILIAAITPCIGVVVVLKRLSMIGDSLSHASLAGVAAGLVFGFNPVLGAVIFSLAAGLGIEKVRKSFPEYSEIAIVVIMSTGVGLAGILSGFVKNASSFNSFLFGSIVAISDFELYMVLALSTLVIAVFVALYKELFYITFDEERHIAYFEIIDKLVDDCLQKAHNQFVEKKTLLTDKELLAFVTAWFQKPFKGGVFQ